MAKLYTPRHNANSKMTPKKETIRMILNYSKALTVLKSRSMSFECIAN